jgi:hypothetical protein
MALVQLSDSAAGFRRLELARLRLAISSGPARTDATGRP